MAQDELFVLTCIGNGKPIVRIFDDLDAAVDALNAGDDDCTIASYTYDAVRAEYVLNETIELTESESDDCAPGSGDDRSVVTDDSVSDVE
jgi:hypothetical protein